VASRLYLGPEVKERGVTGIWKKSNTSKGCQSVSMRRKIMNMCFILLAGIVLSIGEYGWGVIAILLGLGVCAGYFALRWCKQTVKDVAGDIHANADRGQNSKLSPESEETTYIKKEIKESITQVKSDLVQIDQERKDAIKETFAKAHNRNSDSEAMHDYRLFYEMKVGDMKTKLLLARTQLKMLPVQDDEYHKVVLTALRQIQDLLQSYHPDHQMNT
jgi:hypothetical protein